MTDVDRLHRHLEERARIASVEATPITSVVRRAKQRDRRRRAAIGALGVAAVGGLTVGALWMGGSHDTEVRSVDSLTGTVETTLNALLPDETPNAPAPSTDAATTPAPSSSTPTQVAGDARPLALPANGWVAQTYGNDIWLSRAGEPDRLIDGYRPGPEACPAFSPDGERLMFGSAVMNNGGFSDAVLIVFTVAEDGSSSPLTTIPLDGIDAVPCAIWAPDGRWAAFGGANAVWVVDTDTAQVRQLPDYDPRDLEWRPGSDELAITGEARADKFVGDNAPIDIYKVSTGEIRTVGDVGATELAWSPDGSTLAYTQAVADETNMKSGIALIDADGSNQRQLTTDSYGADHGIGVVWSPRGDQIAYQRNRTGCDDAPSSPCYEGSEVVLVTATDADPVNPIGTERAVPQLPATVSIDEPWQANSVTWSPDGTQLLYSAGVQGLIVVPVDADQPPIVLSSDLLTGIQEEHATSPWVPLQQWQPSLTTRHSADDVASDDTGELLPVATGDG